MKWIAIGVTAVVLGAAGSAVGEVNCAQVNRYLQTGRSVQDVSETMVIPEEEVKKCQEQAQKPAEGEGSAAGAAESK